MKVLTLFFGLCFAGIVLAAGCTSEEMGSLNGERNSSESEKGFHADVTLCRKVGRKSGKRIGVGHEFSMGKKSYVRAFVDFRNVKSERPYTVHLVWIRPDGKEMFRKYGEVRHEAAGGDGFQTVVNWLNAEDLHKVRSDTLVGETPDFTLDSRLNTSLSKERMPGEYIFRVYLDRALLREETFSVVTKNPSPES